MFIESGDSNLFFVDIGFFQKMSLFKVPELTEQMRSPGVGLVMRALEDADFDKGFLALLSQVSLLFRSTTTTTASVLRNMNAE